MGYRFGRVAIGSLPLRRLCFRGRIICAAITRSRGGRGHLGTPQKDDTWWRPPVGSVPLERGITGCAASDPASAKTRETANEHTERERQIVVGEKSGNE